MAAVLALTSVSASATTITVTDTSGPFFNIDNSTPTFLTVSGAAGTITDLNVNISGYTGVNYDLSVWLTHVDTATTVQLWADDYDTSTYPCCSGSLIMDDEAALDYQTQFVSSTTPIGFRPYSLLSAFDGESFSGTWQLSFTNTACCVGEGDTLQSWGLTAEVGVPAPATLLLFGLGLVGLRMGARKAARFSGSSIRKVNNIES